MPRRTLVLSWTLRAIAAHLARGEDAPDPDLFVDTESGTVLASDRYRLDASERDEPDAHAPPASVATLAAMARRGVLLHLDVPWIEADRVAEVLICEDEAGGHADIARIVAAAMWGAHPSLERAVERAGLARWQRVEDELALRALTAWARAHGRSIEVTRSGGIHLLPASEAPPRALADAPQV